jgi:hypothetical protein
MWIEAECRNGEDTADAIAHAHKHKPAEMEDDLRFLF